MKSGAIFTIIIVLSISVYCQEKGIIKLNPPDLKRGNTIMKSLSERASAQSFDTTQLSISDLSDLLWAANGINRPESGKRTAPSAMNTQDISIYVISKKGAYFYDAKENILQLISEGDYREFAAGSQKNFANAALFCVLVSDLSGFTRGSDSLKAIWAAFDAGIVSQNISLFCASADLLTRPRAYMDQEKLRSVLGLKESQMLMLNHPVSYKIK